MNSAIEVNQVSKRFREKEVLNDISLTVEPGVIYGLIGPSGSGKTTLVKIIVGMDVPTSGQVKVLGTAIPNLNVLQKIGYMAQSDALYNDLTGVENMTFFASLFKLNKKEQKQRTA